MTFFFDFHPPIFSGINHDQINHDLRARLVVMPDWLRAQAPWQGAADEGDDEEQAAEKDWLSSSLRLLTEDSEGVGVKKPAETYRTATQWWLIMIDTFLYIRTSAGLEAFSSPDTVERVKALCKGTVKPGFLEASLELCRSRFDFQWLRQ